MKKPEKALRFVALSQRMYTCFPHGIDGIGTISVPVGLTADGCVYEYQPSTETWVPLKMAEGSSSS